MSHQINNVQARANFLLREMLGPQAAFRAGQWEAIESVGMNKSRALLVQRTGWGKSIVYFLATKILREQGSGLTLLISPLLSLMRNQIEMAGRIGIKAMTINSSNVKHWEETEAAISRDRCDVLLVSPERLNNLHFLQNIIPAMAGRVGLFVVDEAHCISDWGHDFRPDYRRITRILQNLPRGVPVLATTATANDRVIADIQEQLGENLLVLRGPLRRKSLRLQNIYMRDQSSRMAWLAETIPNLPGTGIVYCLTVADSHRLANWLQKKGINAQAYNAGKDLDFEREFLEQSLIDNQVKVLVATVALGMGFDKPDIGFVIHFQRPGSVVAYYQQVGRAGRAVEMAYGILLSGEEDDDIQNYFIDSAFPSNNVMLNIIQVLENSRPLSIYELLEKVNTNHSTAEKALKLLEIDGAVAREYDRGNKYFRTLNPWQPDIERIQRVTNLRRQELQQMQTYMQYDGCLMEFLCKELDDHDQTPCGKCANCMGRGLSPEVSTELVTEAVLFLKSEQLQIQPRKMWPSGMSPNDKRKIGADHLIEQGRSLCVYGDSGWGKMVRNGKYVDRHFSDQLVSAGADFIQNRWHPEPAPTWVTAIPSHRHPRLVYDYARRLAGRLNIPFRPVLSCKGEQPEQKTMENSTMQARNVQKSLGISGRIEPGPVLLIDDIVDSRWTLTVAGYLLRTHGSGPVFPFTLAQASKLK